MKGFTVTIAEFNIGRLKQGVDDKIYKSIVYHRKLFDAQMLSESKTEEIDYDKKRPEAEIIKVKTKDGVIKDVKIDPNKEQKLGKVIEVIADHDNCLDIFRDVLDYMSVK